MTISQQLSTKGGIYKRFFQNCKTSHSLACQGCAFWVWWRNAWVLFLDWELSFEVMCDARHYAVGAILGQRKDNKPYDIYYASRTLDEAQVNYTTTEMEFLVFGFTLEHFWSYLINSKVIIFTDHDALKHLMKKSNSKPCLIWWVLLLWKFDLEIKDKVGLANVVADHLSWSRPWINS